MSGIYKTSYLHCTGELNAITDRGTIRKPAVNRRTSDFIERITVIEEDRATARPRIEAAPNPR